MAIRLAVFDIDGTLILGETICEAFARRLGRIDRMREIELLKNQPEIALAREEMAGWYREIDGDELLALLSELPLAPGVREGFDLLRAHGIEIAIASITWDFAVGWFANALGVRYWIGTGLAKNGEISHVWPEDKAIWAGSLASTLGLAPAEIAAAGDSRGDFPLLAFAGRAYYVGRPPLPPIPNLHHAPNGDIAEICRRIASLR